MRPGQAHEYGVGQVATCLEQGGIGSNYDTGHNSLLKVEMAFLPLLQSSSSLLLASLWFTRRSTFLNVVKSVERSEN
jgi:hypothetical protein